MTEKLNATCSICGKKYHICNDCANMKSFTPWRKIACSTDCYQIFMAIRAYTNKYTTKEVARDELLACNLASLDTFEDNIKKAIYDILDDTNDEVRNEDTSSEDIDKELEESIELSDNNLEDIDEEQNSDEYLNRTE